MFTSPVLFSYPHPCQAHPVCWCSIPNFSVYSNSCSLNFRRNLFSLSQKLVFRLLYVYLRTHFLTHLLSCVCASCTPSVCSASRAIGPITRKSHILSPSSFIPSSTMTIIISRNMLNSTGDRTHNPSITIIQILRTSM